MALDLKLDGQVALVTGTSRGFGKEIALKLVEQGVRVAGVARAKDALADMEAASNGRFTGIVADLRDRAQRAAVVDRAVEAFGRLDILVNNAAMASGDDFLDVQPERWDEIVEINLTVPADLCRLAGRRFVEQGGGRIINISSVVGGVLGKPGRAVYAATKAGIVGLTRSLAGEWGPHGVRVNAIAPGAMMTELRAQFEPAEDQAERLEFIPAGRFGRLEDGATLVAILASPITDFVNGAVIVFDGGETAMYHAPQKNWKPRTA